MGDFVLLRIGHRIVNLRYLISAEDLGDVVDVVLDAGRMYHLEGCDADAWRDAICHYVDGPARRPAITHGHPVPSAGDCEEPQAG